MSDRFWIYANGDSCFATWLKRADALCTRLLDTDLLELPEIGQVPWLDLRDAFDDDLRPEHYFLRLLAELRAENGEEFIDEHVARMCKWPRGFHTAGRASRIASDCVDQW